MKLFYSPTSPFVRKVRVTAIELGLNDKITLVPAEVAPGKSNEAFARDHNPLRKIPAFALDDGTTLFDSTVICEYLDALAGGDKLIPTTEAPRWQVLTAHALAQGMCDALVMVRYEMALRPESMRWALWIDDQWSRVWAGLSWYESRPEALTRPIDLAQITLGCVLGYLDLRFADSPWRDRAPGIAAWFARMSERPSFIQTAPPPPA